MPSSDLLSKLQSLSDAHKQTLQLINRLAKLPAEPGALSDLEDSRAELGAEIHDSLKEQQSGYELLAQEVEYQNTTSGWPDPRRLTNEKGRETADTAAQIARIGENIKTLVFLLYALHIIRRWLMDLFCSARAQFRKAQLQAKRNVEAARRKERELLFSDINTEETETNGTTTPTSYTQRKRKEKEKDTIPTQDDIHLSASHDVTAALKRTHALMTAEVQRSHFAHETLQQSTKQLESLSESYLDLDTLLTSSRSLIRTLVHSNKSDTWYLETAFWILVVTIGWLVFRRVLYGPGWWLVYLPVRTFWSFAVRLLGVLSSISGAIGVASKERSLSQASESISTPLMTQPGTTGGVPTFETNMPAASVSGGGDPGAEKQSTRPQKDGENKNLSDEIGEMAEQSRDAASQNEKQARLPEEEEAASGSGTVLRERGTDEPPNPKKRMWEEPPPPPSQEEQIRDEL